MLNIAENPGQYGIPIWADDIRNSESGWACHECVSCQLTCALGRKSQLNGIPNKCWPLSTHFASKNTRARPDPTRRVGDLTDIFSRVRRPLRLIASSEKR